MQYEFTVALDGRLFFATDRTTIQDEQHLAEVALTLANKFPASEGYVIDIKGYDDNFIVLDFHEVVKEALADALYSKEREAHQEFIHLYPQWEE